MIRRLISARKKFESLSVTLGIAAARRYRHRKQI